MVYLWMRYRVAEYARWKEAFDTHLSTRQAGGATRESLIMRNAADPHEIMVLLGWNNLEQARAYSQSISLQAALHAMGVVGAPEVGYLEGVR